MGYGLAAAPRPPAHGPALRAPVRRLHVRAPAAQSGIPRVSTSSAFPDTRRTKPAASSRPGSSARCPPASRRSARRNRAGARRARGRRRARCGARTCPTAVGPLSSPRSGRRPRGPRRAAPDHAAGSRSSCHCVAAPRFPGRHPGTRDEGQWLVVGARRDAHRSMPYPPAG